MKNHQGSDYALNKFSDGIVYRFSDRAVKISLEDYLAENPGKTERNFMELKGHVGLQLSGTRPFGERADQ